MKKNVLFCTFMINTGISCVNTFLFCDECWRLLNTDLIGKNIGWATFAFMPLR